MVTPFVPESVESLRARYPAAVTSVIPNGEKEPGAPGNRTHLFDFENGIRLIVSRQILPHPDYGGAPWVAVHVSMSFSRDSPFWREVSEMYQSFGVDGACGFVKDAVMNTFRLLDPDRADRLDFVGWFGCSHIPHFCVWEASV